MTRAGNGDQFGPGAHHAAGAPVELEHVGIRGAERAADLLQVMFKRQLDLHQTTFAMGEAIAHLNALWMDGRLRRDPGADGILRFSPA